MKRVFPLLLSLVFLCGCGSGQQALDAGHQLRSDIIQADGCSFVAEITADYGDELYSFSMQCDFDKDGTLVFCVLSPESISSITGKIDAGEGVLTFDDQMLAFSMLADGQITPVSAPWVMLKAVRCGYISACTAEKSGYYLQIDDRYIQDPLTVDLWIEPDGNISRGEFLWEGRRILTVQVSEFKLL